MRQIVFGVVAILVAALASAACGSGTQLPTIQLPPASFPSTSFGPIPTTPTAEATAPEAEATPPPAQGGLPTPWPAPEATPRPSGYGPLVGRWTHADEFITRQFAFLPDGRYVESTTVGDVPLTESGPYAVDGSTLGLRPEGEEPTSYEFSIDGAALTLVGGSSQTPTQFELEPGSPEAVIEDARATDEQEAQLDAQWLARLPVAAMTVQPAHIAVGDVPADPDVANVFATPTVFVGPELYLTIGLADITFDDGTTGSVQNSTKWYFQPTGRLYTVFTNWPPGQIYDRDYAQPTISTFWSRYTIVEGTDADRLLVESEAGEQIDMQLIHGRRNLLWGNDVYGQVDWENEQLESGGKL